MGLFGAASSSGSGSKDANRPEAQLPTRSSRQDCWNSRDAYYDCLTSKQIVVPPGTDMNDSRGLTGGVKPTAEEQARLDARSKQAQDQLASDPCLDTRQEYEKHCARSWIDYFNKRRVLEERQRLMYAQGKAPIGSGPAPGSN